MLRPYGGPDGVRDGMHRPYTGTGGSCVLAIQASS
jgi:hypothetical protein